MSLMDVILGQKAILVTAVAAVGLFLAALGMALFPVLQQTRARKQEELLLLNGAEAGTDMDGDEQTAVSSSSAARQNNGGTETAANAGQGSAPDSAANTTSQTNAGDQATANGGGTGQPGAAQAAGGKQAQQNPANAAAQPPEQQATAVQNPANAPAPAANQPPPEETAEKLLAEATGDIQALLNSIFDEDDKLAHYDTLLHNMGDVDMVRLADRSAQMLRQLRQKEPGDSLTWTCWLILGFLLGWLLNWLSDFLPCRLAENAAPGQSTGTRCWLALDDRGDDGRGLLLLWLARAMGLSSLVRIFLVDCPDRRQTQVGPERAGVPGHRPDAGLSSGRRGQSWTAAGLGGGLALAAFVLAAWLRPGDLGGGDVKLAALIGLIFGFPGVLWPLLLGVGLGGMAAAYLLLRGYGRRYHIPYAPFLSLGVFIARLYTPL
ncbi:A24 family peptidase [Candidatus Amarobacter glycogenicus]|uniref:A24 family peptidase n=1 Tax=Candidatus Amarobacter glycogenicus TaxID=3140699 RepID=UPI002A0B9FAE|nr:prepilin peptidase [Dehalococcoidia bacterium]